jgi:hypothetical protein
VMSKVDGAADSSRKCGNWGHADPSKARTSPSRPVDNAGLSPRTRTPPERCEPAPQEQTDLRSGRPRPAIMAERTSPSSSRINEPDLRRP